MRNKSSRADNFSLIIHDQEGEEELKEAFQEKRVPMYVGHTGVSHIDPPDACCYHFGSRLIHVEWKVDSLDSNC